ncbi:hypothetical protein BCL80_11547 [Streptomyces avidinii]|uniref:hypothetical protein n=1 Tax=[Kitasatospora] papulosa TaxID=1464011 RepID=UPI000BD88F38|nr:hypothetical protein BCL80_11547 [Streptomyces avidinii]SNX80852.1 hypothetical protein SAMN05421860_11347 [Streptomyces microflavus]
MEMPPGGGVRPGLDLPVVDEVLAAALRAQGEGGVRALGLLRDAHRILSGADRLERPGEIVEACVRSAAEALLKLPGAPKNPPGLKSAAKDLLAAVDAFGPPPAGRTGPPGHQAPAGSRAWELVAEAAEVLRSEIQSPGGQKRRQARGIAERLMGLRLGAAQDKALDTWGALYSKASGTLHGAGAEKDRPTYLYTELLHAARELLVPLPGRADRVLELTALTDPGPDDAAELARWTDPRAEAFFFRSGPSPAWLGVLDEHAGHLLLADEENGTWPAAPFLEHLNTTAPDTARPWLAAHAEQLAAEGPGALDALLRLALADALTPAGIRSLLPHITAPVLPGAPSGQGGFARRLAARWARTLPVAARDGDWVVVAEMLLTDAVDAEHTGHLALQAVLERAHAAQEATEAGPASVPGAERAAALADLEMEEAIARQNADRLPARDVAGLLHQLVTTVHPTPGGEGSAFRWARAVRGAVAGLLRRDVEATSSAARELVFDVDLDEVRLGDSAAFIGPRLARTVLDLAAADAAAGLPLAERLRAWPRIEQADAHLHARLLAAHLAAHPPHTPDPYTAPDPGTPALALAETAGGETGKWWDLALETTERLLTGRPTPEGARLADLVLTTCPPERAESLQRRARAALGPTPAAAEVEQALPAGTTQIDGTVEPLASWLRVWDWSPVLTAPLLDGFGPLLAAVRRLRPAGPPDPRAADHLVPLRRTVTLVEEDLLERAAADGPLEAAAALAAAEDAGADGYAIVLHRLVEADPAAWSADVPAVLTALDRAELGAFYLAVTANTAHRPGALPAGPAPAARAALDLRRTLPAPVPGQPNPTVLLFADQALFDLLTLVWRTGTDLAEDLTPALEHLHALATPLTIPAVPPPAPGPGPDSIVLADAAGPDDESAVPEPTGDLPGSDPAVRALGCLLEYAAAQVRTGAAVPNDVLDLVVRALTARGGEEALTTAIGVALPFLHRHAAEFTDAHPSLYVLTPGRPTPAAAWLRWGGYDPLLLTALGPSPLLDAVRANLPGADRHLAHALLIRTGDADDVLGDPRAAWTELAAAPDGSPAASRLLAALAARTPHRTGSGDTPPDPAAHRALAAAARWWTAALDADLPPGALAAAGDFADTALDDTVWLPLARRSAAHTPAQTRAGDIAERAAAHPRDNDALLLAAHLLTRSALAPWHDIEVRAHARTLLLAADAQPAPEHPAATEQLRRALVEAGEVDLARTTSTTS